MALRVTCLICGQEVRVHPEEPDGESHGLHAGDCTTRYCLRYGFVVPDPATPAGQAHIRASLDRLATALEEFDKSFAPDPFEHAHLCPECRTGWSPCICPEGPDAGAVCPPCAAELAACDARERREALGVCA